MQISDALRVDCNVLIVTCREMLNKPSAKKPKVETVLDNEDKVRKVNSRTLINMNTLRHPI